MPDGWQAWTEIWGGRHTNDRDALLALRPDCIVHAAATDDRVPEAIEDLIIRRGGHQCGVEGPVILQFPYDVLPDAYIARIDTAAKAGGVKYPRQRNRSRISMMLAACHDEPVTAYRRAALSGRSPTTPPTTNPS